MKAQDNAVKATRTLQRAPASLELSIVFPRANETEPAVCAAVPSAAGRRPSGRAGPHPVPASTSAILTGEQER